MSTGLTWVPPDLRRLTANLRILPLTEVASIEGVSARTLHRLLPKSPALAKARSHCLGSNLRKKHEQERNSYTARNRTR